MRVSLVRVLLVSFVMPIQSTRVLVAQAPPFPALRLAPGDVLRIEIKDEPTLSGQFQVDVDGIVLLPALGLIRATSRSFGEVRADLLAAYATQLVDPVIRITPLVRVAVLGEVRTPGLYPADPTVTVADLIATAGGLTPLANRSAISFVREGRVVKTAFGPGWTSLDLSLQSGDQIVVARRGWLSEHAPILIGALGSVAAAAIASVIVR